MEPWSLEAPLRAISRWFAALLLCACARGPDLPEARALHPKFSLQRADVDAIHADALDATFRFAVHNPYRGVTGMEEVRWRLFLPGARTLDGTVEGLDFDGARAGVLDVPISLAWSDLGPALVEAEATGGIPWRMEADAVFDLPREDVRVATEGEGVLPYAPPPVASLVAVLPFTFGEQPAVEVVLDTVGMPRVARLGYRLDVGALRAAQGVANASWDGDRVRVVVPVEADTFAALQQGAHARFRAEADVRTPHGVAPLALDVEDVVAFGGPPRI